MDNNNDRLSPENSPSKVNHGVRRLNNIPLFLVIGVLMVFALLIAMTAIKRGSEQNESKAPVKNEIMSTQKMAEAIISGHQGQSIIPPLEKPHEKTVQKGQLVLPVAVIENSDVPPKPNMDVISNPVSIDNKAADSDRIYQMKIEELETAIKAKTAIDFAQPKRDVNKNESGIDAKIEAVRRQREALESDDLTTQYKARLALIEAQMNGHNTNGLGRNNGLLGGINTPNRWRLGSSIEPPKTPYTLLSGAVIPGILIGGIDSELPGQIIGQVSQNVYDSATGKHLIIPQGTKLLGVYSNDVGFGQSSLFIAWQRLTFPDGKTLDIGSMNGADSSGMAGFRDKVDNHRFRMFSSAILMSGIVGGISYSQAQNNVSNNNQPTASSVMSEALGQQLGQVAAHLIEKNLNVAPTLTIRPGYLFNIIVIKDLVFNTPYAQFDY